MLHTRPRYAKSSYRSVEPQTVHGNVHQVDHVPNGPTNSAAITTPIATLWRQAIGRGHSTATLRSEPTTTMKNAQPNVSEKSRSTQHVHGDVSTVQFCENRRSDHRGGRTQLVWRTFMMTCLRWILGYMRLEIWHKIGLSADWCLCTALCTRSAACYYWAWHWFWQEKDIDKR